MGPRKSVEYDNFAPASVKGTRGQANSKKYFIRQEDCSHVELRSHRQDSVVPGVAQSTSCRREYELSPPRTLKYTVQEETDRMSLATKSLQMPRAAED